MQGDINLDNDETVAERLKNIRISNGYGQKKMADTLDVSISAYQNYEKGCRPVTKHILNGLLSLFEIDPTWILTGAGDQIINQNNIYKSKVSNDYEFIETLSDPQNENQQTIGGFFLHRSFIMSHSLDSNQIYIHSLSDDTMEPYISPGEPVLVDTSQKYIKDGVFILEVMDQKQVRRIQLRPDGIWITADNKIYDPIIMSESQLDKIKIIGKVFKINQAIS